MERAIVMLLSACWLTSGLAFNQAQQLFLLCVRNAPPTPPLPYDAEVEYLESTGTQYIDTGIVPLLGTSMHIKFSPLLAYSTYEYCFCGAANALNSQPHYDVNAYRGHITIWNGSSFFDTSAQLAVDAMYDLYVNASSTTLSVTVNGSVVTGSRNNGMYSANSFYIFSLNVDNQAYRHTKMRLYGFEMTYDSVLLRDMIPVRFTNEQNQSEGAMYDRVSGALFRNAGTGAFTIGPDK